MNDDIFGGISFLIIFCASIFFIGYGFASYGVIKINSNKWECTTSAIIIGKATCSEYKLKETK